MFILQKFHGRYCALLWAHSAWARASGWQVPYDLKMEGRGAWFAVRIWGHQVVCHFWWPGWNTPPLWNGIKITSFSYLFFSLSLFVTFLLAYANQNFIFVETKNEIKIVMGSACITCILLKWTTAVRDHMIWCLRIAVFNKLVVPQYFD